VLVLPFAILGLMEFTFRQFDWFADPLAGIGALPERVRSGRSYFPDWHTQIQMPKPKNRFRIITLGGSSTFGFGVTRNFSQIVADRLRKSHPQSCVTRFGRTYRATFVESSKAKCRSTSMTIVTQVKRDTQ